MSADTLLVVAFTAALIPGLIGVLLPVLPSLPLMFLVTLLFVVVDGTSRLLPVNLLVLFMIAAASVVTDYAGGTIGAKFSGATGKSMLYGLLGMIVGLILLPPFGGLLGLFVAVLISETKQGNYKNALRAASGSIIGAVAGIGVNLILAVLYIVLFFVWAIR